MSDSSPQEDATRVLVLEDDTFTREALSAYLDDCGYQVRSAATATDALAIADHFEPAVLLSDWDLGGERTGVDVARQLQSRHDLKVVFISGKPLHRLREAAADLDVLRYLRKPISLARLARLLDGSMTLDGGMKPA